MMSLQLIRQAYDNVAKIDPSKLIVSSNKETVKSLKQFKRTELL